MQRRLAAGKLEDFNSSFAVNDALNAPLQIFQWHCVHFVAGAGRRVRVARRATEIARVDNFNERQAGGELFKRTAAAPGGVSSQRSNRDRKSTRLNSSHSQI